ncbi:uncharacterized protein LOC114187230 isoform X1 [Vigna unguiculata]|nr:uncharacterized protein LOC114187230 isoform X1 [Vigna unguiculata]
MKRYYSSEFGSFSDSDTKSSQSKELLQMVSAILEAQREGSSEANSEVTLTKGKKKKSSKERRKRRKYYSSESGRSSDPDTQSSETEINKSKMDNDGFSEEINKSEMETDGFSADHHGSLEKGKHLKYAEEERERIEIFSGSSSDYYMKVSAESDMSSSSVI